MSKFHHIALRTADYDKTLKFYCKGLGYTLTYEWKGDDGRCCMIDLGEGGYIEAYEDGGPALPEDFEKRSGCFFHLAVATSDPDGDYKKAVAAGAVSKEEPYDTTILSTPPLPIRIAFVYGPSGELIEFFKVRDAE